MWGVAVKENWGGEGGVCMLGLEKKKKSHKPRVIIPGRGSLNHPQRWFDQLGNGMVVRSGGVHGK